MTLALATMMLLGVQSGGDYRPVQCAARRGYEGRALHAPVDASLAAPLVEAPLSGDVESRLDAAFAEAQRHTLSPPMSVAVARLGEGLWHRTEAPGDQILWWASAGKTFTAAVVMQLADEGKLSLDDPISRWIEDVPNGRAATIRDLLQHTSGLFSANEDPAWRAAPRAMTMAEMMAILKRHGAMFCPGQHWRYSNSGYSLLGEVIRAVDGRPWHEAVTARIIAPLGLKSLRALAPGDVERVVVGATAQSAVTRADWPGPAGSVVGRAEDMARFWAALLEGRVVRPETRDLMFRALYPMFDGGTFYGLGTMVYDVPDRDGRLFMLGHGGGAPGASAIVGYSPKDRAIVAVAVASDAPAPAVANLMLRALRGAAPSKDR